MPGMTITVTNILVTFFAATTCSETQEHVFCRILGFCVCSEFETPWEEFAQKAPMRALCFEIITWEEVLAWKSLAAASLVRRNVRPGGCLLSTRLIDVYFTDR